MDKKQKKDSCKLYKKLKQNNDVEPSKETAADILETESTSIFDLNRQTEQNKKNEMF